MTDPIFPIDSAEHYFRSLSENVERSGNILRWPARDGITEFFVEPINQPTPDGLVVSDLVTLRHVSPLLENVPTAVAVRINQWATLSALISAGGETPGQLISKIGVFSTDREAAERVYAPLICMEAAVIGWYAACVARGVFRVDPAQSPLTMTNQCWGLGVSASERRRL